MAERGGFEPPKRVKPLTHFPGVLLQPLGHLSVPALRRHKAAVNVFVDGVAISCASYIAMAGDTITMAKNAQMMIHGPWTIAAGNASDMREQADILDRYAKAMASAYADKSGKSYEDALALLTDGKDHWYLADEALAEGFADVVDRAARHGLVFQCLHPLRCGALSGHGLH